MKKTKQVFIVSLKFIVFLFLFISVFWLLDDSRKSGNINFEADNVSKINNISCSTITANLYDHYAYPANELSFTNKIFFYSKYDSRHIQYQTPDGSWVNADVLSIIPHADEGRLVMTPAADRVDYQIKASCISLPEDPLSFLCNLQYQYSSESRFEYVFNAPAMEVYLYFQDGKHSNANDKFYIEFSFDNCTISHNDRIISQTLRLPVSNQKVLDEVWSVASFQTYSIDGSPCITDSFKASNLVEDVEDPDIISLGFVNEIDVNIEEGSLSVRNGSYSSTYDLFSDHIYIHLNEKELEDDKEFQSPQMLGYFDEYGNYCIDGFHTNFRIVSGVSNEGKKTSFDMSSVVDKIELNEISLFRSFKTYLKDEGLINSSISSITSILAIYGVSTVSDSVKNKKKKRSGKHKS